MQDKVIYTVTRIERDPDGYTFAHGSGCVFPLLHKGDCGTFPAGLRAGDRISLDVMCGMVCSWEVIKKGSSK